MTVSVDMGVGPDGDPITIDLEELLATRLLVQGNSGSGKSHLLRRLLERSAAEVQQIVIDPEGDFVTLSERYGHVAVEAADFAERDIVQLAGADPRASRVGRAEPRGARGRGADEVRRGVPVGAVRGAARALVSGAGGGRRSAIVRARRAAGEVAEEVRRASLGAMTNLMCRGRKRGLAGVIATQRLAKLAKNVAAEASNFLMGRTFLDIDMARAADLLGMERRQAEAIRDLPRGTFLALGPAIARRPVAVAIGAVDTAGALDEPQADADGGAGRQPPAIAVRARSRASRAATAARRARRNCRRTRCSSGWRSRPRRAPPAAPAKSDDEVRCDHRRRAARDRRG